jgi:DNA-directed RNA polymerase specialized sigma24 family protein
MKRSRTNADVDIRRREVIRLREVERLTWAEIARRLGYKDHTTPHYLYKTRSYLIFDIANARKMH